MKTIFSCLLLTAIAFTISCNNNQNTNAGVALNPDAAVKQGVAPQADPEVAVVSTDYGNITIELYSNIAPQMVTRFKELAREGFYDGTNFHRVDPRLGIIQGGDPNTKNSNPADDGAGESPKPDVPAEFSDVPYETGIVGAARQATPDTANCQFFIMTKRQAAFDKRYTVFGKVVDVQGNAVNLIAGAPTEPGTERPVSPQIIKSITIQTR